MKGIITRLVVIFLAAAAANPVFLVTRQLVHQAFGIDGPMCPSRAMRLLFTALYLGLLGVLVGAVGALVSWILRESRTLAYGSACGAVIGVVLFFGGLGIALRLPAVRKAALTGGLAVGTTLLWGQAIAAGVGAGIGCVAVRKRPNNAMKLTRGEWRRGEAS